MGGCRGLFLGFLTQRTLSSGCALSMNSMWLRCWAVSIWFIKPLFLGAHWLLVWPHASPFPSFFPCYFTYHLPYSGCRFLAQKELCCSVSATMGFLAWLSGYCRHFIWQYNLLLPIIILPYLTQGKEGKHKISPAVLIVWKYVYNYIPCKFSKYAIIIIGAMMLLTANINAISFFNAVKYQRISVLVFYVFICTTSCQ